MSKGRLDPCFRRLVQSLRDNPTISSRITVMIGAGCSLTSSKKDVTTYGIIKSLVSKFSANGSAPDNWIDLYKCFVNDVWEGQGRRNRTRLLEESFSDMTPSIGYQILRWLIENSYVNDIVTTNFDLMIDTALDGLSYRLIVGSHEEIIGTHPTFTLIKAHGDLRLGDLRFAPHELSKLPEKLSQEIRDLSAATILVVGYRGQDIGLLNSLDASGDYNAYWADPVIPDRLNTYETGQIYTWLASRNSDKNFLYGDELGKFDELFQALKEELIALKDQDLAPRTGQFYEIWKNNIIFEHFRLNGRFLHIFEHLHELLELEIQNSPWRITQPYFAADWKSLLLEAQKIMQGSMLPKELTLSVSNEIDALLFSFACSVRIICQGYPYQVKELIEAIRIKYEAKKYSTIVGKEFWSAAIILSEAGFDNGSEKLVFDDPIRFYFDRDGNLQTVLRNIDLDNIYHLLSAILLILLYMPTSADTGETLVPLQNKKILEKYLYGISSNSGLIRLEMLKMPLDAYTNIYQTLLKNFFLQSEIGTEYILHHDMLRVSFPVEKTQAIPKRSIWEALLSQAQESSDKFFRDFIPGQVVALRQLQFFFEFLNTPNSGLFIIGNSGAGKTTSLQLWLSQLDPSEYLIYPVCGRDINGLDINITEKIGQLHFTEMMLEQRQQMLLLVFDAINELRGTFSECLKFYRELLGFCDKLMKESISRIKLVISCRSDFYSQLKKSSGLEPSTNSFYVPDTGTEPQAVLQLAPLSDNEVIKFTELYHLEENGIHIGSLTHNFGELIYLPINLKIICDVCSSGVKPENDLGYPDIYEAWFHMLIQAAAKDALSEELLQTVVFQTIYYRYFEESDAGPFTHRLSADLSARYPMVLAAFEWLTVHKVFHRNADNPNLIQFSHDRLEEHFFSQYVLEHYRTQLADIDQILAAGKVDSPIVRRGLSVVIANVFHADRLTFTTTLVAVIRDGNHQLLFLWIDTILQIMENHTQDAVLFLKDLEQYVLKGEFAEFLQTIMLQIRHGLDDMTEISVGVVDAMEGVLNRSNANENLSLKVLAYYLKAKQRFLFPGTDDKLAFSSALTLCKQADACITDSIPDSLTDDLHTLEALLLQNQGQLNEAITLMEACCQRQSSHSMYDLACLSALHLGAMYREMTRFDDALALYDSFDADTITNPEYYYRLLMNTGIIYKNKVQNALFSGQKCTEANLQHYQSALDNFNMVCEYAEHYDNVRLRLEIYAEHVELACIAYYLDLGTIKQATEWVGKMDQLLPRYSVPVERIQCHRMWARVLVLERDFSKALEHLERGFSIAVDYNIPFRAADCCNQITGMICDVVNEHISVTKEVLDKGLYYGDYAIQYYKKLNNHNHRYLQDALAKYERIQAAISEC